MFTFTRFSPISRWWFAVGRSQANVPLAFFLLPNLSSVICDFGVEKRAAALQHMAACFGHVVTPPVLRTGRPHCAEATTAGLEGVGIPPKAARQPSPCEVFMAAGWILGTRAM